jgi:uncharacterized membrane protein
MFNMKINKILLIAFVTLCIFGLAFVKAQNEETLEDSLTNNTEYKIETKKYKAEIIKVDEVTCAEDTENICKQFSVRISNGDLKDTTQKFEMDLSHDVLIKSWKLEKGDKVIVTDYSSNGLHDFEISELDRINPIFWFGFIYVALVILIAKKQGIGSLIGLVLSILAIVFIIIPMTLKGYDAVLVSIFGGFTILLPSLFFSHGFSYKTLIALSGTMLGLAVTGILAVVSIDLVKLTGYGAEESLYLNSGTGGALNIQNILLASIIIGGIGLIDDVTIGQVAVIKELYEENKNLTSTELYKKAMNVGRDHIASMVNTLFLAYAASSLPLLMVLVNVKSSFEDIVNMEAFSEEIIRTLVASTGLVLTVPLTTFIAAVIYASNKPFYERFKR